MIQEINLENVVIVDKFGLKFKVVMDKQLVEIGHGIDHILIHLKNNFKNLFLILLILLLILQKRFLI